MCLCLGHQHKDEHLKCVKPAFFTSVLNMVHYLGLPGITEDHNIWISVQENLGVGHQVYTPRPAASSRILQVFVNNCFLTMILIPTSQVYS